MISLGGIVALEAVRVGKLSGVVGTYAATDPEVERIACERLGLEPEPVSTQVVARDRHAAYFSALAVVATGIERLATNVRHWQRTEVGEAEERFTAGQKGSSAMPQSGQLPGPTWRTSGCIGQVYSAPTGVDVGAGVACW